MMDRRTLFGTAAGSAAMSALFRERAVFAATSDTDVELRGANGRMERLGSQELESQLDFNAGFRVFQKDMRRVTSRLLHDALEEAGIDPRGVLTHEQILEVADNDPMINLAHRAWISNQQGGWKRLQEYFHVNADLYLSEMEANDKVGPGTLELRPAMYVPEYTCHEIHMQPGGYVGDPFAGHIYHYNTNAFYYGITGHDNEQDQYDKENASRIPIPTDGKVKRILDMGCGVGQLTCALKERFPDAEVWGVDIGGPMVRYAHMRANDIGIGANFRQALAEETGFPDGYFDLVTSYLLHHEVPGEKTKEIIEEAHRVLRPGGVYTPLDIPNGSTIVSPYELHHRWFDHRWNNEVWRLQYDAMNFTAEIAKRGFKKIAADKPNEPEFFQRNFYKI